MKNILSLIFLIFINLYSYSLHSEESLTIKQQLDRIVQEVSDLNKAVFNKSFDSNDLNLENNQDDAERFTSIDIRMYDLERDIKNLTLQFEEIIFKLDDLSNYIQKLENEIDLNIQEIKNKSETQNIESNGKEKSITSPYFCVCFSKNTCLYNNIQKLKKKSLVGFSIEPIYIIPPSTVHRLFTHVMCVCHICINIDF